MILSNAQLLILANLLEPLAKKTTLACLNHVYFTPAGQHVIITASDLSINLYWPVTGTLPKAASCPRDWFLKVVRSIRGKGHLELRLDEASNRLTALPSTVPSSRSPEPCLPLGDAPEFTTAGFTKAGHLSAQTLRSAHASLPFMSTDQTRYVINGIHIEKKGIVVATDGRRLAHHPTAGTDLPDDITLPPALLKLLHGSVDKAAPDLAKTPVWVNGSTMLITLPTGPLITASLIDGNFPNWRQVVPHIDRVKNIVKLQDDIAETLKHHNRSTKDGVTVQLDLLPDKTVSAQCFSHKGPALCDPFYAGSHLGSSEFSIAANAEFLLDCITFAGTSLRLISEADPLVNGDPGDRQTVCMPLRCNNPKANATAVDAEAEAE